MPSRIKQVLQLAALGIAFVVHTAQAGMTTPGQFAVSPSGAATYSIPIQVPPGIAGIEPKLALSYNSQAGNGLLGMGWSLSGLSAITRCPRTMAQDGVPGSVNYDYNDRYCLDGQRLIALNKADGADGTEYRTELDSFAKIVSYGSAGNGPAWFKVWTKAGQVMEYGNTADSRIEFSTTPTVRTWALNRLQDTKGNYLTVSYSEDTSNGIYFAKRIDYTGNVNAATAPTNSVVFEYDPTRQDITPLYDNGAVIKNPLRLANIKTYAGTTLVKSYALTYQVSPTTQQSRLASLKECSSSEQECLPPTSLTWTGSEVKSFSGWQPWSPQTVAGQFSLPNCKPLMAADVNGDGKPDLICAYDYGNGITTTFVQLNQGTSFSGWQPWSPQTVAGQFSLPNCKPLMAADVNGDGKPDLVCAYDYGNSITTTFVQLNQGTSFSGWQPWSPQTVAGQFSLPNCKPLMAADINGDGLEDLICPYDYGNSVTTTFAQFMQGEVPDLLTSISSADGKSTKFTYKPITDSSLYTKDATAAFPVQDLQYPLYVVSSVTSSNGIGGNLTTTYTYGGLKAEVGTGRGMLGFRWMQSIQQDSGISSYSEFRQDFPYTGLPSLTKKTLAGGGNNGVLNQVSTQYDCLDPATGNACTIVPGHRYFPYAKTGTESSWDVDGSALPTIVTAGQYDIWGNAKQITVTTSDGYSKTTDNIYAPADINNWYLGRLTKATVTSTAP